MSGAGGVAIRKYAPAGRNLEAIFRRWQGDPSRKAWARLAGLNLAPVA